LVYLPPYFPGLNPTEECFSFVKTYIRQHGHEFHGIVEGVDKADPVLFLCAVLDQVTPAAACGCFHDSGYL
ncbi:hypothetical protein PAXRUDRAFT_766476, partial [Paxillus rubicundulus Ve08.2h10]